MPSPSSLVQEEFLRSSSCCLHCREQSRPPLAPPPRTVSSSGEIAGGRHVHEVGAGAIAGRSGWWPLLCDCSSSLSHALAPVLSVPPSLSAPTARNAKVVSLRSIWFVSYGCRIGQVSQNFPFWIWIACLYCDLVVFLLQVRICPLRGRWIMDCQFDYFLGL
jgi:hypothetical protein